MTILLVNPSRIDEALRDRTPNVGLLAVASYLHAHGCRVSILDTLLQPTPEERLCEAIRRERPNIVGFGCIAGTNYASAKRMATHLRQIAPDVLIACGGQHVRGLGAAVLTDCPAIDVVVAGPGELPMIALARAVQSGASLSTVNGIIWRGRDGTPTINGPERPPTLADLPPLNHTLYPDWTEFIPSVEVVRGCPCQCAFCNAAHLRSQEDHDHKPADQVLREVTDIINTYGEGVTIKLHGSLIGSDPRATKELLAGLSTVSHRAFFSADMRVDSNWDLYAQELAMVRFRSVFLGLESADPQILLRMRKTTRPDIYLSRAAKLLAGCTELGIPTFVNLIIGYFGESEHSIALTKQFIEEHRSSIGAISAGPLWIYPGSEDWRRFPKMAELYGATLLRTPMSEEAMSYAVNPSCNMTFEEATKACLALTNWFNQDSAVYDSVRGWKFFAPHGPKDGVSISSQEVAGRSGAGRRN